MFLVRHGEAAAHWGQAADPGLSRRGREQADLAAERLITCEAVQNAELLTSPKARARETAEVYARRTEQRLVPAAAFNEIPAPVPLAFRREWLRAFMTGRWSDATAPGVVAWRRRLLAALAAREQSAVVFTHFLVINAAVASARGSDRVLQCWPANGSVHEFEVAGGVLRYLRAGAEAATTVN